MDGTEFGNMQIVRNDSNNDQLEAKKKADTCLDINAFAGYLDNSLADNEKVAVEAHMAKCVPCRTNLYEVRMLMDLVPKETPEGLADNVKKNLHSLDSTTGGKGIKV